MSGWRAGGLLEHENDVADARLPGGLDLADELVVDGLLELGAQVAGLEDERAGEQDHEEHLYILLEFCSNPHLLALGPPEHRALLLLGLQQQTRVLLGRH